MLTIDVYSDVICPWCWIGKRRMEKGLALAGRAATVRWHPFELNPDMPPEGVERRAYRVRKFGSWERSLELDAQVGRAFAAEGLAFNPDRMARTPNTFDAHRLIWLAGEQGVQDAVVEALFKAYFGRNDFFPFTRDDLKKHDPDVFELLGKLWQITADRPGKME